MRGIKIQRACLSRTGVFLQAGMIYAWLVNLTQTDSYYSVYLLCAIAGVLCLCDNYKTKPEITSPWSGRWANLLAGAFSLAVVLANYPLFQPITALMSLFNACCTLSGGFFVGYHVLLCAANRFPLSYGKVASSGRRLYPIRFFLLCFASISAFFLLYLFFVAYPGYVSTDSLTSLNQIATGEYVNNNPFWYTMLIRLWVTIGMALFNDMYKALALYSSVQILIMSACFSYGLVTLYQDRIPSWCIAVVWGIYTLLPYNITYSVTMWKDILFSGSALLIVASLYRIFRQVGASKTWNYIVFALGGVGFCLMRTNGWFAYLATALIFLLILRRQQPNILKIMAIVLIICWILTNPILMALGVEQTDFVETLSVPIQQIARVIAEDGELSEADTELLSQIFWMERVKELYSPEIVDPIKFEALRSDRHEYLREHLGEYFSLWVRLGIQYPAKYLKAWIELTKGFWNGGYYFWIYTTWTYPELAGSWKIEMDNPVKDCFAILFRYLEKPEAIWPLYSIGLQVWLVIMCCFICAFNKRKETLLTIPMLVLIAGLWIGTPVYAEYRYAYPFFTSCPVILLGTLFHAQSAKDYGAQITQMDRGGKT